MFTILRTCFVCEHCHGTYMHSNEAEQCESRHDEEIPIIKMTKIKEKVDISGFHYESHGFPWGIKFFPKKKSGT